MKNFLLGLACMYLVAGLMIGMALKTGVPATNAMGVAYLTLIWPAWISQIWTGWDVPVPSQSFSFDDEPAV